MASMEPMLEMKDSQRCQNRLHDWRSPLGLGIVIGLLIGILGTSVIIVKSLDSQTETTLHSRLTRDLGSDDQLRSPLGLCRVKLNHTKTRLFSKEEDLQNCLDSRTSLVAKTTDLEADLKKQRENVKPCESKNTNIGNNFLFEKTRDCPAGWSYFGKTTSCFKVFESRRNFDQAEAFCNSENGHLASIHSEEENDFVYRLCKLFPDPHSAWIGFRRNSANNSIFEWTDGSRVDFTKWAHFAPDNHVEIGTNIYLRDADLLKQWNDLFAYFTVHTPSFIVCKIKIDLNL